VLLLTEERKGKEEKKPNEKIVASGLRKRATQISLTFMVAALSCSRLSSSRNALEAV